MRALRSVFEHSYPRLVQYLSVRLGDADQAEDVAQEAFIRLMSASPRDPVGWLFTVAGHLASDHARVARGRARRLALIGDELGDARDSGPELSLLRAEEAEQVRRALAAIPERDSRLLMLHHAGVRYRDIARELGLAPSSVGSLLTRAQRQFVRSYEALEGSDVRHASG